jgi:hypothetical protein
MNFLISHYIPLAFFRIKLYESKQMSSSVYFVSQFNIFLAFSGFAVKIATSPSRLG